MSKYETERQQLIPITSSPEYPLSQNTATLAANELITSSPLSLVFQPDGQSTPEPTPCLSLEPHSSFTSSCDHKKITHTAETHLPSAAQLSNPQSNELPDRSLPVPCFFPRQSFTNDESSDRAFGNLTGLTDAPLSYNDLDEDFSNLCKSKNTNESSETVPIPKDVLDNKEDTKSHLSASPDFWRRVSPQLTYIDSCSYGGSHRSGSIHSSNSVPRERNGERDSKDDLLIESQKEKINNYYRDQETLGVRLDQPLDSERSVTWNLPSNAVSTKSLNHHELSKKSDEPCSADTNAYQELKTEEQNDCQTVASKDVTDRGFFARLRQKLTSIRSMHYDENFLSTTSETGDKISIKIDKIGDQEASETTKENEKGHLSPHSRPLPPSSTNISAKSANTVTASLKAGKKDIPDTCSERNPNLSSTESAIAREKDDEVTTLSVKPETKEKRGKLKRYFSLDSSPAGNVRYQDEGTSSHQSSFLPCPVHRHEQCPSSKTSCRARALAYAGRAFDKQRPFGRSRVDRSAHYYQNQYYMEKDLRYYFQHPWFRLFVAYLVIFCNFLLFAEDPLSHSHTESNINMVGNVFSFVATKYPKEWYWKLVKVVMWVLAVMSGMLVGKVLIHGLVCKRIFRLKMFRHEQGSWMCMFLTVIVSMYMFSYVYNLLLLIGHPQHFRWQITSAMGLSNQNMMKAAATCTWLGDLVTALMVTDMMLQDRLYPHWGTKFRRLYNLSNVPRILIFWVGSIVVSVVVIFLIVSDYISWDKLNQGFVETTELSRAFLASFILVMDLLIVMQDWDFPHFTSTVDVNLPGFSTHTLHWRWAKLSFTGKWFNYGIIFMVMIFDLNMWKNQIFYIPEDYGQYVDPVSHKVYIVEDEAILDTGNRTLWSWSYRSQVQPETGKSLQDGDQFMYSRWMGYSTVEKCTAFIPNVLGMTMFFTLITLYGRFPPNQDGTYGGRLKKRPRSSWRQERRSICEHYCDVEQACPPSLLGDSLYRGSKCPNCVYQGTKCMSRGSSSQPDFKDAHHSDSALASNHPGVCESQLDDEDSSHKQYTVTQHSDPGLLDGRTARGTQMCSNPDYRDIRMLENEMKSSDRRGSYELELPKKPEPISEDSECRQGELDLGNTSHRKLDENFPTNKATQQNTLRQKCYKILYSKRKKETDVLEKYPHGLESVSYKKDADALETVGIEPNQDDLLSTEHVSARIGKVHQRNFKLSSIKLFRKRHSSSPNMHRRSLRDSAGAESELESYETEGAVPHDRVLLNRPPGAVGVEWVEEAEIEEVLFVKPDCNEDTAISLPNDFPESPHSSVSENLNRINFGSIPSVNL